VPESHSDGPVLAVLIPVFNEEATLRTLIERVVAVPVSKQIIAIDDGSSDGSPAILAELAREGVIETIIHPENRGKGAAIRSGLALVQGQIVIVQDADLEYDPGQFPSLIEPIVEGDATVVFGSRFRGTTHQMSRWHWFGNHFVTSAFNLLYGTRLTDMETCYKAVRREAMLGISLESDRWGIDPEITAKLVRAGHTIVEVPVDYSGRDFGDGKKLRWKDGFAVLGAIIRYRFGD
jgi:glycosyltransferase involved in cell wall biosynthesis